MDMDSDDDIQGLSAFNTMRPERAPSSNGVVVASSAVHGFTVNDVADPTSTGPFEGPTGRSVLHQARPKIQHSGAN